MPMQHSKMQKAMKRKPRLLVIGGTTMQQISALKKKGAVVRARSTGGKRCLFPLSFLFLFVLGHVSIKKSIFLSSCFVQVSSDSLIKKIKNPMYMFPSNVQL